VEQNNPASVIKKIAEDNLTMPEALIDSINELALESVGDIIIEPGSGSGPATIAREHLKTVKKLIKTYEYLVEG
jgi:2-succinyl-5-enolpyruvyl-6-hydroxy-3-cyclohexene-1-carboxylate synthase